MKWAVPDVLDVPGDDFTSNETTADLLFSMFHSLQRRTKQELREGGLISVIVDESTDASNHKNLVILVRFVLRGEVQVRVLDIIRLEHGRALDLEVLLFPVNHSHVSQNAIVECLAKHDLALHNVVCLGGDGASVISGDVTGLQRRLKIRVPLLIYVWCNAHKVLTRCVCTVMRN